MTFRDFMALALYDSEYGFYTKGPGIGTRTGTFNTNAMFPAFAFALAHAIHRAEDRVGESLRIVEFGGGTAELAANIRSFLTTPHEYVIVDISPGFRAQQTRRGFQAADSVDRLPPAPTFAFGNEVLDALPVHRVMGDGFGDILEFFVALDEKGEFIEMPDNPSTPLLAERLQSEGVILGRGQIAEICLDLEEFMENAARPISKGYLTFIDYGSEASDLYSHCRRNGTLRSFRSQEPQINHLELVGDQDLTADVDYTALKMAAKRVGLQFLDCLQQGTWLKNMRVNDYSKVAKDIRSAEEEVSYLTNPARLGTTFDIILFKTAGVPDGYSLHIG